VLGGGHKFFPRLGADDDAEQIAASYVDACFDLARILRQPVDTFLNLPFEDLAFYSEGAERMLTRMKGKS
jgi:hypothetical protein